MSNTGKTITISKEAHQEIKRLKDEISDYQQDMAVLAGEKEELLNFIKAIASQDWDMGVTQIYNEAVELIKKLEGG